MLYVDAPAHVQDFDEVPTDRRVALRLLWLLDDPNAPLDEIARVISADPALSVRILALANVPFYREAGGVTALPRAVSLLGAQTVRSLASTAVLHLFSADRVEVPDQFWLHAITAAVAAARIAGRVRVDPAEALTTALLHDIGEQLLRARDPQRFDEIARTLATEPIEARMAIERRLLGIDHASLGAQVLAKQGLPPAITNAVQQHHILGESATPLARVVHVADCIAKIIEGDSRLDLDATLRAAGIPGTGDGLVDQTEADRRALLRFLADFLAPRTGVR
ncbi:MAG TPA: HDOD domain-containing protein [Acidimicrobiia bacterium]|jgi:putative nucleotidyltransferase with HDIG domain|nr:HDOD domain-containing protein [Acidimicrobiia bacterium]